MQNAIGVGIKHFVVAHDLKGRQFYIHVFPGLATLSRLNHDGFGFVCRCCGFFVLVVAVAIRFHYVRAWNRIDFARTIQRGGIDTLPFRQGLFHNNRGATNIGNVGNIFPCSEAVSHFHKRTLGITEHQQICFCIEQYGATDFFRPVVIVRNSAQAGFDTTDNNRDVFVGFTATLGIHRNCAIRPLAAFVVWRVSVIVTKLFVGRVAVDHGVHVARRYTIIQVRLA